MTMRNLSKKRLGMYFTLILLLLVLNGCGASTKNKSMEKLNSLERKIQESADGIKSETANATIFENAVNQKDYGEIEELLADEVTYVVEASDCCGKIAKEKAVTQLKKYLGAIDVFNFSQEQQIVKKLKVNIADQFENYTIGIASGKEVLAYKVNSAGKVNDIYVVGSYEFFDIE